MPRRTRALIPRRHPRLEIVPMIDVMMFLLVFFVMIALSMIPNAGLPVELPAAATARPLRAAPLVVAIDRESRLHVEGTIVPADGLAARLRARGGAIASVIISADRDVSVQTVVAVMDAARAVGATDIGLATVRP